MKVGNTGVSLFQSLSVLPFGHLSHTGFKTSLPAAVGSALSSDGISTDNADRVDGHLAEESTDTFATCLYGRDEVFFLRNLSFIP
ncbi:hypothetical protein LguiA_035953 [Lonicera macranthoides]